MEAQLESCGYLVILLFTQSEYRIHAKVLSAAGKLATVCKKNLCKVARDFLQGQ